MLFLCCTTLYLFYINSIFFIVPVIITIVLSSLFIYYEDRRIKLAGNLLFAVLCVFFPAYIIFLPILLYDILHSKYQLGAALVPFLYIYHLAEYNSMLISFTAVFTAAAYLLKYKTDRLNTVRNEYNDLRDSSAQMSLLLEEKNQSLLKNQDYEINLATLNERNRISKEIHDSIGHLLSRSLLQVGALLTISKDEVIKEGLSSLKESLSDGMDQIRSSIHNMYDDSIDLYLQIDHLVKEFTFCPITYDYDIKNQPSLQLKHSFIAITKESLANIIRHSNATKVSIALHEHPAMYQLIIQDNGTLSDHTRKNIEKAVENPDFAEGMGLHNIIDRVKGFGGNIHITADRGFKIFISIPKKIK
jgi:signal transduction histidine kinase